MSRELFSTECLSSAHTFQCALMSLTLPSPPQPPTPSCVAMQYRLTTNMAQPVATDDEASEVFIDDGGAVLL